MIEREEQEYALADKISVPSMYAAQTFVDRGLTADKIIVNGMGFDLGMFKASSPRSLGSKPRIVFAGVVGISKVVKWLLEAFKRLSSKSELHLIGPVSPDFEKMLRKEIGTNVFVRGALPGHELSSEYGRGDIFACRFWKKATVWLFRKPWRVGCRLFQRTWLVQRTYFSMPTMD